MTLAQALEDLGFLFPLEAHSLVGDDPGMHLLERFDRQWRMLL